MNQTYWSWIWPSVHCLYAYALQVADIFTKALGKASFGSVLGKLGVYNIHLVLL